MLEKVHPTDRSDEVWVSKHYFLGDQVIFEAIGLMMSVEEIYARVGNKEVRAFLEARNRDV